MRHASAASKTLASPLIVTGEVSFAFTAGIFSVIAPFAEVGTEGLAAGVDATGDGEGARPGVPAMRRTRSPGRRARPRPDPRSYQRERRAPVTGSGRAVPRPR